MTQSPTPDDARLDNVQERIDDAKSAEADLHDRDVLGDVGDEPGSGVEDRGAFEPSGDDTHAGENPVEGEDADTPGEAGEGDDGLEHDGLEHRDEAASVEEFDGPGPNPA